MVTTFNTDQVIHKAFKMRCMKANKSMSETLTELMKLYTEKGETLLKATTK